MGQFPIPDNLEMFFCPECSFCFSLHHPLQFYLLKFLSYCKGSANTTPSIKPSSAFINRHLSPRHQHILFSYSEPNSSFHLIKKKFFFFNLVIMVLNLKLRSTAFPKYSSLKARTMSCSSQSLGPQGYVALSGGERGSMNGAFIDLELFHASLPWVAGAEPMFTAAARY